MDSSGGEDPCTAHQLQRMGSGGSSVVLDPETGAEAESRKLPSSQYKGVVPQPNGRWGAQIYEKHQRVWLGTFDTEPAAARSYDVAAQRFRGRDAVTNFKPLSASNPSDAAELAFLARHSKAEVVDMLRKHTYADELRQGRLTFGSADDSSSSDDKTAPQASGGGGASREHLFDKTVTPSDVGKLNRLVIPKQHAERHLPALRGGGRESALVSFEDAGDGKVWRFRYSYWNSSQSYVLTKGWSRFVKEKGLVAGDTVRFLRDGDRDGGERKLYVECRGTDGSERGAKAVRLFGVDIFRGGDEAVVMRRKRDLGLDRAVGSSRLFKKKFVVSVFGGVERNCF